MEKDFENVSDQVGSIEIDLNEKIENLKIIIQQKQNQLVNLTDLDERIDKYMLQQRRQSMSIDHQAIQGF